MPESLIGANQIPSLTHPSDSVSSSAMNVQNTMPAEYSENSAIADTPRLTTMKTNQSHDVIQKRPAGSIFDTKIPEDTMASSVPTSNLTTLPPSYLNSNTKNAFRKR